MRYLFLKDNDLLMIMIFVYIAIDLLNGLTLYYFPWKEEHLNMFFSQFDWANAHKSSFSSFFKELFISAY